MEAGLDSLGAVELKNSLATRYSLDLPATLTFDYPTVAALAAYIGNNLSPVPERSLTKAVRPAAADFGRRHGSTTTSAVVGVSCR
jgi:hypothetical protein